MCMLEEMMLADKLSNPEKTFDFSYCSRKKQHLSDSIEFMEFMKEKCLGHGNVIGLFAPTGSGKTVAILNGLQEGLFDQRQVLLVTPNKIQSEQNARYAFVGPDGMVYQTEAVVGGKGDFTFNKRRSISAVYDAITRIFGREYTPDKLRDTVLVIDEVHQLFSAMSYREECIMQVERAISAILTAGGNVIYMTGTPRKMHGRPMDYYVYAIDRDYHGKAVSDINTGKIELVRKLSHNCNMQKFLFINIRRWVKEGYIPLIRVNHKKMIHDLASQLEQVGIVCCTLTADEKGYHLNEDTDMIEYDSEVYESILTKAQLPYAQCYLVTSVMEVGTSIETILMEDGTPVKDSKILPVFVARNPKECDFDDARQFFARPRFSVDKCVIVMNYCEDPHEKHRVLPDIENLVRMEYHKALLSEQALAQAREDRSSMYTFSGEDELEGLSCVNGRFVVNNSYVYGLGCKRYYMDAYQCPQYAEQMLKKEFGIAIEVLDIADSGIGDMDIPLADSTISDELMEKLSEAIKSDAFIGALVLEREIQDIPSTREIRAMKDGLLMMQTLKTMLPGDAFSREEALAVSKRICEEGRACKVDSKFRPGCKVTPKEEMIHGVFMALSRYEKNYRALNTMAYLRTVYGKKARNNNSPKQYDRRGVSEKEDILFQAITGTDYLEAFIKMLDVSHYYISWKNHCLFMVTHTLNECRDQVRKITYMYWNRMDDKDPELERNTGSKGLVSGAEYMALRFPERHFFRVDEETGHPTAMYPEGFINKTLTIDDFEAIAAKMNHVVSKLYGGKYRVRNYTPALICRMIGLIYNTKASHGKLVDIDDNPKFVVVSLRRAISKKEYAIPDTLDIVAEEVDHTLVESYPDLEDPDGGEKIFLVPSQLKDLEFVRPFLTARIACILGDKLALQAVSRIMELAETFQYRPGHAKQVMQDILKTRVYNAEYRKRLLEQQKQQQVEYIAAD